jgi:hypothetical protein
MPLDNTALRSGGHWLSMAPAGMMLVPPLPEAVRLLAAPAPPNGSPARSPELSPAFGSLLLLEQAHAVAGISTRPRRLLARIVHRQSPTIERGY